MNINLLHIETATKSCSVAVSVNGQVKSVVETISDGYIHGEKLTLFIEQALEKAQLSTDDLHAVSLSSGPGSYTGLRIGCSTAKGICFAKNIPMIAINSLQCIALATAKDFPSCHLVAMIDARRMEAFTQVFCGSVEPLSEIEATIFDENTFTEYEPFVATGDGAKKLKELWSQRNVIFAEKNYSTAESQAQTAYEKYLAKDFEDLAYFEPFYLKDFVAKKSKKEN